MDIVGTYIKFDPVFDYLPGISTLTNLVKIFQKVILGHCCKSSISVRYAAHLGKQSLLRCVVLILPLLGNLTILLYDLVTRKKEPVKLDPFLEEEAVSEEEVPRDDSEQEKLHNQELVKIRLDFNHLGNIGKDLRDEKSFMKQVCQINIEALLYVGPKLARQTIFLKECLDTKIESITDHAFILELMHINGKMLQHVGKYKQDKKIVLAALEEYPLAYQMADESLKEDYEIMWKAFSKLFGLPQANYPNSEAILIAAIEAKPHLAFSFACTKHKKDREILEVFVRREPTLIEAILELNPHLRSDSEFMDLCASSVKKPRASLIPPAY